MTNYKELVKEKTSIRGYIEEVERFETWWNKNLATVIAYYDDYYRVFLLVYDPVYGTHRPAVFPTSYDCSFWGDSSRGRGSHSNLSNAQSEAWWLRDRLTSSGSKYYDNPILLIHPYCDTYRSFETFVTDPYVTKNYSTSCLKPLDLVKTDMGQFHHVGVYLGKIDGEFKVCQFTKKKNDTTIDRWSDFLEGSIVAYHPVIPFKDYRDITRQIVWAKDKDFRKNDYNLPNRNCEHFGNMIVYGINYSEQVENNKEKLAKTVGISTGAYVGGMTGLGAANFSGSLALAPFTGGTSLIWGFASAGVAGASSGIAVWGAQENGCGKINNGKGSTIKLINEINESDGKLGKKYDYETKKYWDKYLQEIPPKESCRIM